MRGAEPGVAYSNGEMRRSGAEGNDIIGKFNPGIGAQDFTLGGAAKLIPKGSDLVFEIHYTAVGTPQTDRTKVGLILSKTQPNLRYVTGYGPTANNLVDPRGATAICRSRSDEITAQDDVTLAYVQPHMHLRGKDYEVRVIYSSGESETVFRGKFDFNWQFGYELTQARAKAAQRGSAGWRRPTSTIPPITVPVQSGPDEGNHLGPAELG